MRKNLDYGVLHAMDAFLRVVDAGSFTAAAEHMGLTTAQMSRLVSELETRLQTKLLQRTTRRLKLTGAGERYAAQCRTILDLVSAAESEAGGASLAPSGRLRVLCMSIFGGRYIVPLVARYCAMYPQVTLEYSSAQHVPNLLADGVDVSIYLTSQLPDSGNVAQRLGATHGVLCASPEYLARHGTPATVQGLLEHQCLRLINPSAGPQWELTDGTLSQTLTPSGPLIGDTPEAVLHGACQHLGIAMLPLYAVVDQIRSGALVNVLPGWRTPQVGVFVLIPSRKFIEAKTRAWLDLLKAELPAALRRDGDYFDAQGRM